jgi:CheY-like chemotaxis protein
MPLPHAEIRTDAFKPSQRYNRAPVAFSGASICLIILQNGLHPLLAASNGMARSYRILIADDNQANAELLEAYLANLDCELEFAVDGQDTLAKVQSFQPDLILLDVMMPKLSGFEVCKKIKADPATRQIMVLMVTALNELGDIERAVDAGTNDFLSKPVNKVELVKRVENMFKLKDVQDENERLRRYIQEMEEQQQPKGAAR